MSAESLHSVDSDHEFRTRLARRRESYDLTGLAGRLLYDPNKPADQQHRTVWCHRSLKNDGGDGGGRGHIYRRDDNTGARLTGVVTCGMVWTCKVCAARVAEQRREELQRAIVAHVATGGHAYLLTLTAPHDRALRLAEFRRLFTKALQKFKNSRSYKGVRERFGHIGSVRSLELTWTQENGWHLHSHDLYFAKPGLDGDMHALDDLRSAWVGALIKVGLGDQSKITWMMEHALDLRGGQAAADYVTKFGHDAKHGLSGELVRSHAKRGVQNFDGVSWTAFQLLSWAGKGDDLAACLFREYAEAMADARMLYWSPKLKARVGIIDRDDAEVAADDKPKPTERCVATITGDDLALMLSRGALGELLEFVCLVDGGEREHVEQCVRDFLDGLRSRPPTGRGVVRIKRWKAPGFNTVRSDGERLVAA